MILIHDWRPESVPLPIFNVERKVARKCSRCGKLLTLTERDAAVLCPSQDEAIKMFSEPVLCEESR